MTRRIAGMTVKDLRDESGDGVHTCKSRIATAKLLDRCDQATTLDELRDVLADSIRMQTGES